MKRVLRSLKIHLKSFIASTKIILKDSIQNGIAASVLCPKFLRIRIYRLFGHKIELNCNFSPRCYLGYGKGKLNIGKGSFINYNTFFGLSDNITIGKNVNIAMNCKFINESHEIGDVERRAGNGIKKPIFINDGVWIGADSLIMPAVTIGKGSVIGAGSLVISDCEENAVYLGRPAKLVKRLHED